MTPLLRRLLVVAVSLVGLAYGGLQLARRTLDIRYQFYIGPELDHAREHGLLLGEYRAACTDPEVTVESVYAARSTVKKLGYLLIGTRILAADTVTILARLGPVDKGRLRLVFEDSAGVDNVGGRAVPYYTGPNASTDNDSNDRPCCSSDRSRVPERFWLARDGERLCEFRLDEATRTDAPPRTRWTW